MTADPFPTGPHRPVRIAHIPPLRTPRRRPTGADAAPPGRPGLAEARPPADDRRGPGIV